MFLAHNIHQQRPVGIANHLSTHQAVKTEDAYFMEFLKEILAVEAKLPPFDGTAFGIGLLLHLAVHPDVLERGHVAGLIILDRGRLLAVRQAHHVSLEIQYTRRQILNGV